jgi:hypothetical protein
MRALLILTAAGTALALGGCVYNDYGGGRGDLGRHGGRYEAYYDGYYGPSYGGTWRDDGFYYYRAAPDGPYVRDEGRHFRRDAFDGFQGVGAEIEAGGKVGLGGVGAGAHVGVGLGTGR